MTYICRIQSEAITKVLHFGQFTGSAHVTSKINGFTILQNNSTNTAPFWL